MRGRFLSAIKRGTAGPSTGFGAKARQTSLRMTVHFLSELGRALEDSGLDEDVGLERSSAFGGAAIYREWDGFFF